MPLEIEASRSGFPPAGTIFTSFSGSMPRRRNDSRNPISEMLPKRLTEPTFPRNCSVVVILAVLTIWSIKVGMIDKIITVSAPPSRGFTTLGAEVTTISRSPATNACIAGGPTLKKNHSTAKPCLAKNPLSCATHNGVCEAVIAPQPTRTRSCAADLCGSTRFAVRTTKASRKNRRIDLDSICHLEDLLCDRVAVGIPRLGTDTRVDRPTAQHAFFLHTHFLHYPCRTDIIHIADRPNTINPLLF